MNALRELLFSLPESAFVHRDRGSALYVTDAPKYGWSGKLPGFSICLKGDLAFLTPDASGIGACGFLAEDAPERYRRFRGDPSENIRLFTRIWKTYEAPEREELLRCDRMLRQGAAAALRGGPGGGLAVCAAILKRARDLSGM